VLELLDVRADLVVDEPLHRPADHLVLVAPLEHRMNLLGSRSVDAIVRRHAVARPTPRPPVAELVNNFTLRGEVVHENEGERGDHYARCMTPSETVTAFIEAIERKDVAAAAALASPSISYENMPMQPIVGRDAMAATLEMFLGNASEVDWVILRQHEFGNVVFNERIDRFQHR
jgi:hypothetical protein